MQRTTKAGSLRRLVFALALALGPGAGPALAQPPEPGPEPGWRPFASFSPWYQTSADIDGGGDFHADGGILRVGVNGPLGGRLRGGVTVNYDYVDYGFSSPPAFGGVAPWSDVRRIGLGASLVVRGASGWSAFVRPSADYFKEHGAQWSEALTYGAVLAVSRGFGQERQLGIGVGVFDRLEETRVFPFVLVDWAFTERLRLANPLPAGPTGGAGLELSYYVGAGWVLGAGVAFRSARFRLREHGPYPNGIGEERGILTFVHAGRHFGSRLELDLYAGTILGGQLRVEDSRGGELIERDFDPAPLLGLTVSGRF